MTAQELHNKMLGFSSSYFLIDVHRDRDYFYALSDEEIQSTQSWLCYSGIVLNKIMDGQLEEAWQIINNMPVEKMGYFKLLPLGLTVVHPEITWNQLFEKVDILKKLSVPLSMMILTAGRPSLLNGFNDFSRIGPLLPNHREEFLDVVKYFYDESFTPYMYNLCLAEYYYQANRLVDADMLVSSSIKKFDSKGDKRIVFSSLYLQSKILLAHGKNVKSKSIIKNMRQFAGESGNAEFSYNIDAAETLFALYDGNMQFVRDWLKNDAPDEFADFNMLDLYRYMIKMRCYIASKNYTAVIALVEKLRPLVEAGRRSMDMCELDLLLAMSLFASGNSDTAFEALRRALKIARMYRYHRLVADEGEPMLQLLIAYIKHLGGGNSFLMNLAELTRDMAIRHPLYMKISRLQGEAFTRMEIDVLSLLEQGKTKEEIAEYFFISVNTVKFHIKNIYTKLGAGNVAQAVWNARVMGVI